MRHPPSEALLAPPAGGAVVALKLPGRGGFPPVDEHLVRPETREEMVRGERIHAQPALEPHGDRHFGLDFVLGGHVREGYIGSTDLLTRVLHGSDFAADTCIRKDGKDPNTGRRYLEELAFEVVNEQTVQKATERAEDWSQRGVRRVIGIFVKKGTVEEWMPHKRIRRVLDPSSVITDPCLVRPLTVKALLDAAAAKDEVARALDAQGNPVIMAIEKRGELRGEERGRLAAMRATLRRVLARRKLVVSAEDEARIEASTNLGELERWIDQAVETGSAAEALR